MDGLPAVVGQACRRKGEAVGADEQQGAGRGLSWRLLANFFIGAGVNHFVMPRAYEQIVSVYHDGTRQAGQLAQTSRRTFKLSRKLTVTTLATLKAFWDAAGGGLTPFIFYNPFDGTPVGSNYDPTGASTVGQYFVRFSGNWSQATDMQRTTVPSLALVQVA